MKFKKVLQIASVGAVLAVSCSAAHASPQTHHCKQTDGTMDMTKTKKQCLAAKGTWAKDAPAAASPAAAPAAPAAAAAPAPKS